MATQEKATVEIGGRELTVSNLKKVFYPKTGFTKGDVLDYYVSMSPYLLPFLKDRPLTLKRYPEGVEADFFYQKECPSHRPSWLSTTDVWSEGRGKSVPYCMANDLESLVWLVNIGDLEIHTFLHKCKEQERPDWVVFDLDPGPGADLVTCSEVALWIRDDLQDVGLKSWVKTSGGKGMQLYIPLNGKVTYDQTKPFSNAVARSQERKHPKLVTSNMRKDLRKNKVFIDWSQNDRHKTTVCVYSLRARPQPTVSMPLRWEEVERTLEKKDAADIVFDAKTAKARLDQVGDLFRPLLKTKQELPSEFP